VAKPHTVRDPRGRAVIERRNLPKGQGSSLANDAYHFLLSASWTSIGLLFAGLFLGTNLLFATVLWLGNANVTSATGFLDYFWFSVQSLATIGYGTLAPADTLSNVVVTIESFLGFGFTALITGIFFARFSRPSARVMFSDVVIIAEQGGERTLTLRVANARITAVVEANINVYLTRDEVLPTGERTRRIHELPLRLRVQPVFALSWNVVHVIDEKSPLFGIREGDLKPGNGNIVVTLHGIDDRLAATIHARHSYHPEDLVFDRRFTDIIGTDPDGSRYLDFASFHQTEPLVRAKSDVAG
jgi:inward rectifier potassium channel